MVDLIVITAYCPTEEQEIALERCINSFSILGFHIALISHTHIPLHIQKKCQFYVYDYKNEISNDHNLIGNIFFNLGKQTIHSSFFNKTFYGFAIYRMLAIASQIAINFGYENIHLVEYDSELLNQNLVLDNRKHLETYDSILYTDSGDSSGFLLGAFSSFKVKSLPEKFKSYDMDFIEKDIKKHKPIALESVTKNLFINAGNVLFKNYPSPEDFKVGKKFYIKNVHFTLYYNPKDGTLNIFYNALNSETPEEINIIVNKNNLITLNSLPKFWHTKPLGLLDQITHVRIDNSQKVIYQQTFGPDYRELIKSKSFIV
jgi:hypothetical protein